MKLCPTGCGSNVRPGYLMCACCWALVPRRLQVEVLCVWDTYRRASKSGSTAAARKILLADYRKAADAAIAAAR